MIKTMKIKDYSLSKLLKKEHEGKWIALSPDYKKIIAYSGDLHNLEKKLGDKNVVYIMGLSSNMQYAFLN